MMTYQEIIATNTGAVPRERPPEMFGELPASGAVLEVARLLDHLAFEAVDRDPALADDKVTGGFYSRRQYAIAQAMTFKEIFARSYNGPGR